MNTGYKERIVFIHMRRTLYLTAVWHNGMLTYLYTRAKHDSLRDEVGLWLNVHVTLVDRHHQHPEVGASQVQGQEPALLCNRKPENQSSITCNHVKIKLNNTSFLKGSAMLISCDYVWFSDDLWIPWMEKMFNIKNVFIMLYA